MATLQHLLVPLLIVTYMLQVGLAAPPGSFRRVRPQAVARGLLVMLVLGPLLATLAVRVAGTPPPVTVALVVLSTVGVLPLAPRRLHDDHECRETGVVLSLLLAMIAIFVAAPLSRLLLAYSGHVPHEGFRPGLLLLQVLVLQGAPLVLGLAIARSSRQAPALERWTRRLNLVLLAAVVLVVLVPHLGALLAVGWRGGAVAVVYAVVLAGLAYLIGGPTMDDREATVAIANKPNVGLALKIATAAAVERRYAAVIVGVFLVRALSGAVLERLAARRALHLSAAHGH